MKDQPIFTQMTLNDIDPFFDRHDHSDIEPVLEESTIVNPFDPSAIDIKEKTMTIDLVVKRMRNKEIDLNPDFQRKSGLWTEEQQSRLIESLMIRIPLPAFYFDGTSEDNWLVVDGLQRLTALNNFVIKEDLELKNLEYLTSFNGMRFPQLPRQMQRRIEEAQIIAFVINPGTPGKVKFNIFKRINTGGLTLTPQEIRHALHQGEPANFVAELAANPNFLIATDNSIKPDRMADRDFVLHFLAFSMTPYMQYTPDLDYFLNETMEKLGTLKKEEREQIKHRFEQAMITAFKIFGNDAFRKRFSESDARRPINKSLFEAWAVHLGNLSEQDSNKLIERKDLLKKDFIGLMSEDKFVTSITYGTSDKGKVMTRFSRLEELIKGVLR